MAKEYDIIIGLEIHAELRTRSKMFCACDNNAENYEPNTTVCPICLGHPGTLPVPNHQAINWTIMTGLALNCQINKQSKFDRKNYFYPDLPKGYQISQYDQPLAFNGYLEIDGKRIDITRIHLEEDTGQSFHFKEQGYTLLDFNRAGTPLMELVTEPVIHNAAEAKKFCQAYQQILRYLEISNADMEKGEMRCEANISLQTPDSWQHRDSQIVPKNKQKLNPKVEIKNINSFRAVEKAINFEIERQQQILDAQGEIDAETRGWDENKNETVRQRLKESSADYRYFPEPDIPPLKIDDKLLAELRASLPELPINKKARFIRDYGLHPDSVDNLINDKRLAAWTENVISELEAWIEADGKGYAGQEKQLAKTAVNWINAELIKHFRANKESIKDLKINAENFAELISLVYENKINSSTAQKILGLMYEKGTDPTHLMDELGLKQVDDDALLKEAAQTVINDFPEQVQEYRSGKTNVIQFLIGQMMAKTQGRANPRLAKEILEKLLQ